MKNIVLLLRYYVGFDNGLNLNKNVCKTKLNTKYFSVFFISILSLSVYKLSISVDNDDSHKQL